MQYLLVLFALSFAVLIHEAGHYFAARRAGIPIAIFSVGLGPALWRRRHCGTEFRVAWIPFGGYVLPKVEDEKEFNRYKISQRLLLAAGGPMAGFIYPWLCFVVLGIASQGLSLELIWTSLSKVLIVGFAMLRGLGTALTKPQELSGIIGIVAQGGHYIGLNWVKGLSMSALLSINLAIFNLLPLPALDGGKIFLYLLEKIHPKLQRLQEPLTIAGWVCIIALMLYVTGLDIGKYILRPLIG